MCKVETNYTPPEKCYIPARFVLAFLVFSAMCLEYAQRVCLSVTIVVMVNNTALEHHNTTASEDLSCPNPLPINETDPVEQGGYVWNPSTQGVILGAYFYGYVCTQIIGGRLSELAGGKWPLGLSILVGSLLTLITPIAADIGVVAIVLVRVTMGLIHGVSLPTAFALFANWAPDEERSTLLSLCLVGDHLGIVLTMPFAAWLSEEGFAGGWPSVFYVLGVLGCIWFVFWACLAYNKPSDHPRISRWEIDYIQKGQKQMIHDQKLPIPWKKVLCSMSLWSVAISMFCSGWGGFTILTELPSYLQLVGHLPIQKNGLVNSLIQICTCVTLFFSAYLSDYLLSSRGCYPTSVRKGFQIIATLGPALCSALIPLMGCRIDLVILLLALATGMGGLVGGGHISIVSDMAPHYAGTLFGLVNCIGCTSGIFAPLVAGLFIDNAPSSVESWSNVFYLSAALYLVGGLIFQIFASAEKQSWARIPSEEPFSICPQLEKEPILFSSKKDELANSGIKYGTLS